MRRAYWIKRPNKSRSTFAVVAPNGKTVDDPKVYFANQLLQSGAKYEVVDKMVTEVVRQLNLAAQEPDPFVDSHKDNLAILDEYWLNEASRRPHRDQASAKNRLNRAILCLGKTSLLAAPIRELQDCINRLPAEQQKSRASALNQLLRRAKRADKLFYQPAAEPEPTSLTLEQLEKLCAETTADRAHLFRVAFATGARAGELFAPWFWPSKSEGFNYVRISRQRKKGQLVPRKWRKIATPRIVPELLKAAQDWTFDASLDSTERSRWVQEAALKAGLPPTTFHNFRHSYARYWSEKGVDLTKLSLWLGDGITVVEKYYRGWQLNIE